MEFLIIAAICLLPFIAIAPYVLKVYLRFFINLLLAIPTTVWALQVFSGGNFSLFIGQFPITGLWEFKIDILSAFFILIINTITIASSFYSFSYLKENRNSLALSIKFISASLLHLGMLSVCMIQTFIPFLIVWEVMSLSSFMLIIFQFRKELTLKAGLNYLVQMHIGVVFLLVGMLIVQGSTGASDFEAIGTYFGAHSNNFLLFLVFFVGFGFKVGFVPLHTWMPEAYASAPSHVSALMAGVVKKMGIYGILRILFYVQSTRLEIGLFILGVSLITCLYGVINAIMQSDIKKLLAYSSVENMGIIGIGLGMGMIGFGVHDLALAFLGFAGALLQILNHSLFKAALFYGNGAIYQQTGSRNINELGGVGKLMPFTSLLFLFSSIAVCGLPPFNGFVAEYILYSGLIEGMNATFVTTEVFLLLSLIVLSLVGGLAIYAYTKLFGLVFLGNARSAKVEKAKEVSVFILLPQILLLLISLSIGVFPNLYFDQISKIVDMFVPHYSHIALKSFSNLQELGHAGLLFIGIVLAVLGLRKWAMRGRTITYQPTWGCGYSAKNPRMQYTSSSWADYFVKFGSFFTGSTNTFKPIDTKDIFPTNKKMQISYYDKIEKNFIEKGLFGINYLMRKMAVVQTGQTQFYILYGFLFLLVMSIITFFNII